MDDIRFFVACTPPTTTAQQKRLNHKTGMFFKDKHAEEALATYDQILQPHAPTVPISGPVRLVLELTWPWRKNEPQYRRKLGRVPHVVKPDADNIAKALIDRLPVWRFIEDDKAIADLTIRKWWGDTPGILVHIVSLNSQENGCLSSRECR